MRADECESGYFFFFFGAAAAACASCGIDEFLLTGVKRVAYVTNTHDDHGLGRACFDHIAARATDLGVHILRMYICFHKRLEKIALAGGKTSSNFGKHGETGEALDKLQASTSKLQRSLRYPMSKGRTLKI